MSMKDGGIYNCDIKISLMCIRYMLGMAGIPSLFMFIGFCFMPESPRWLVFHNKETKAYDVLNKLRDPALVSTEFDMISDDYKEYKKNKLGTSVVMGVVIDRVSAYRFFVVFEEVYNIEIGFASTVCWVWFASIPATSWYQYSHVSYYWIITVITI